MHTSIYAQSVRAKEGKDLELVADGDIRLSAIGYGNANQKQGKKIGLKAVPAGVNSTIELGTLQFTRYCIRFTLWNVYYIRIYSFQVLTALK
jgi:hypothetical protein